MGAENLIRIKNDKKILIRIDTTVPTDSSIPKLYRVAADGKIEEAGLEGTQDHVEYIPGGTILSVQENVPEDGSVTYTIGMMIDEISNTYVAGSQSTLDSSAKKTSGMCFMEVLFGIDE